MRQYAGTGKLFVIEGADGTGKSTQFRMLESRLRSEGRDVAIFKLPQYGKKSAGPVEEYLAGAYGADAVAISPYAASLLYAVDRYDASFAIRDAIERGMVVLLDRYVDSNVGHQGGKITDLEERKRFVAWLYDTEYRRMAIPEPDMVCILHLPHALRETLIRARAKSGESADIHETDRAHMRAASDAYAWLAREFPERHTLIDCAANNEVLSKEAIHERIRTLLPLDIA